MAGKKTGYFLIVLGVLALAFSLGADLFRIGSPGIQAAQLLGAQIGVLVALGGAALIIAGRSHQPDDKKHFGHLAGTLFNQPLILWTLAGFLLAYLLFFITPMFLDYRLQFQYFYRYIPDNVRIGLDIRTITKYISLWLVDGKSPYLDNVIFYPPLYNILLAPLLLVGYPNSYYLMLALSIASYFLLTFVIPARLNPKRDLSFLLLFFITGIFSYGLQFELERAQFNLIAFLLCIFSIYLYHYHQEFRYFAYLFFSISIQLKVYPLIFIIMFIRDWRDWKNNLLRLAGLGAFNFALLFVLGVSVFNDFIRSTIAQVSQAGAYTWVGNHSIKAFVYNLTTDGFGWLPESTLAWLRQYSGLLEFLLMLYIAVCFISIIAAAYHRKERGLNPYLLLACTIGAMVIPSVSHDYKLAILAAPLSIAFSNLPIPQKTSRKLGMFFLVFLSAFAYSVTLYPFKYRPDFLANSFPLLLVILTAFTIAYHLDDRESRCLPGETLLDAG
jgi:hypothetical protein